MLEFIVATKILDISRKCICNLCNLCTLVTVMSMKRSFSHKYILILYCNCVNAEYKEEQQHFLTSMNSLYFLLIASSNKVSG